VNTAAKLGAYGLSLAVVFGGATAIGSATGPIGHNGTPARHMSASAAGSGQMASMNHRSAALRAVTPTGLEISADGYTMVPAATTLEAGNGVPFAFRIDGPDGDPITAYDEVHDKALHLIVVRRDLSHYQHVHPVRDAHGTWSIPLDLSAPGTYRVLADFQPTGADMSLTLGADVSVPGAQSATPLPPPSNVTTVDGYRVTLHGNLVPGRESTLALSVSKDGKSVTDLQPYLAAYGHLVALRSGDLAYLHVHPDGAPGDGHTRAGPAITFHAQVPSVGTYRLYLDFRHDSQVHTAELTAEARRTAAGSTADGSTADHDESKVGS